MSNQYTLGLSFGYHDSSAALVKDGKLLISIAEERLTRQKHDSNFPNNAIEHCLKFANIKTSDLSSIAFHENPYEKFTRILCSNFSGYPNTRLEFLNSLMAWSQSKLWPFNKIYRSLSFDPNKIFYYNHHYSHAMTGFLGSGFNKSCILVLDAVGDWASTSLYTAEFQNNKPQFTKIKEFNFPSSLCLAYSAITEYVGFKPNDSECSTMALAAFGKPVYKDKLHQVISLDESGYTVNQSFFNFINYYKGSVTSKFVDLFGEPRSFSGKICFSTFQNIEDSPNQHYADMAASIQSVYEDIVLKLVDELSKLSFSKNLCIVGGGAMNCVAMSKVAKDSKFENFYIPPDPGDGGSSIGVALYTNIINSVESESLNLGDLCYTPYRGLEEDSIISDLSFIDNLNTKSFLRFESKINKKAQKNNWKRITNNESQHLDQIVDYLMNGKIVGLFQGKHEIGPRALGSRSILIRPDNIDLAKKLSQNVKLRAEFRPYALSILPECAEALLELDGPRDLLKWMQSTARVKPDFVERVRSACHVDFTTRPHICDPRENPFFFKLLTRFKDRFGIGALLNTSFNESGFPIVSTPTDALVMFARTSLDVVAFKDTLVIKDVAH